MSASFVYDGLGRRESKTINGNLTEFLYDRLNPVQETSGATILANILPALGIDEFLTRTDVVAGVTSNFLTDALGSPVAVTDSSGVVQTEYTYEPFGKTTFNGPSNSNPYQYTGRENDGTGLFYYRARYYNPQLQRFISEDRIEIAGGSVNMYAYVSNAPLEYIDPNGLVQIPCVDYPCNPWTPPWWNPIPIPYNPKPKCPSESAQPRPYPDVCKEFGCTTDLGKVYVNGSDEPIRMHPPREAQRVYGDVAKSFINLIRNNFGPGANPDD